MGNSSPVRTVRVALESYRVDSNHYPDPDTDIWHPTLLDIPMITTPTAYLSSFPKEVFPLKNPRFYFGPELPEHGKYFRYYNTRRWAETYPEIDREGLKWFMMSNGPDLDIAVNDDASAQDTLSGMNYMYYDPTNGSVSWGDIIENNLTSEH